MKYKFYLLLIISSLLLVTGCGNENKHFETAKENMQNLKSYSMQMNMSMEIETDGLKLEVPINIDADVDVKNKKTKMTMSIKNFMGLNVEAISYTDSSDENNIVSYSSNDGSNWIKKVAEQNENQMENMMSGYEIKKVKSDDNDYYLYEATVDADKVINNINAGNNSEIIESIDMGSDIVYKYYVNKKTKYVEKIVADIDDIATFKNADSDLEMSISKIELEIVFSNFDKIDEVVIPDEVIESTSIKKVSCSGTEVDDDMTFETDVLGTFKGGKLTNFNVVMKYDLTPYLSGTDFASTYQYMETYMKSYLSNQFTYEGVTLDIYDDNPYMAIEVDIDLEVIDEEIYEEMQIGDIDKNVTISEFKKEFEEMDYMCE